jgi:hypothetical protein
MRAPSEQLKQKQSDAAAAVMVSWRFCSRANCGAAGRWGKLAVLLLLQKFTLRAACDDGTGAAS